MLAKNSDPMTARRMPLWAHVCRPGVKAGILLGGAAEQLDQQRSADIEQLVQHRIHFGVQVQLLAGHIPQASAQLARRHQEERQDGDADQGQAPLQREHDCQCSNCLDQAGDNADKGITDGALRPNHIVIEAADQFADLGMGVKAQRHALQMGEQVERRS